MASPRPDTPLSLAHLSEIDTPPLALLEAAAVAGFASVGLRTAPAAPGTVSYPLATSREQAQVRRKISDTGVNVLYIELISVGEGTDAEAFRPMLETGGEIGATRLAVAGEGANFDAIAAKLAHICDIAAEFAITVDVEFMPYRGIGTFRDALEILAKCNRSNARILLDALHFHRSASSISELANATRDQLGTFQLCDAPARPPADLVAEARLNRLLPGEGNIDLWPLIDRLPDDLPIGVEVPLYTAHPEKTVAERLTILASATRAFLAAREAPR